MAWYKHNTTSPTTASPVIPIVVANPKIPENTTKQKVLGLAKSWKEKTLEQYKTVEAIVRKHPYLAGGLSIVTAGVLLASLRVTSMSLGSTGNTSTNVPPPPPAPVPDGSFIGGSSAGIAVLSPQDSTKFPDDKSFDPSLPKPKPKTVISVAPPSPNDASFFGLFSSTEEPVKKENKDVLGVKVTTKKETKDSSEFPEDDKQSTLGTLFSGIVNRFSPPPPPPPKWHAFITTHEYFPLAVEITVFTIGYLVLNCLFKAAGSGTSHIQTSAVSTTINIPGQFSQGTSVDYYKKFHEINTYAQINDLTRYIDDLVLRKTYFYTDLSMEGIQQLIIHASLKIIELHKEITKKW